MLMLSPGRVDAPAEPRDVTVVVDVSGSMAGEKITQARAALVALLETLVPTDRFRLVAFSNAVRVQDEGWQAAEPAPLRAATAWLERLEADGGTNIEGALEEAFQCGTRPRALAGRDLPDRRVADRGRARPRANRGRCRAQAWPGARVLLRGRQRRQHAPARSPLRHRSRLDRLRATRRKRGACALAAGCQDPPPRAHRPGAGRSAGASTRDLSGNPARRVRRAGDGAARPLPRRRRGRADGQRPACRSDRTVCSRGVVSDAKRGARLPPASLGFPQARSPDAPGVAGGADFVVDRGNS